MENPHPLFGQPLLQWDVDEFPRYERGRLWYVIMAILGVALLIFAIVTASYVFAVFVLLAGIVMLLLSFQQPQRVPAALTTTGVIVGDTFYSYKAIKDFSLVYRPPEVKALYIDFVSRFQPLLSVPLEDQDPNEVRGILSKYCPEDLDRSDETLTDLVRRLYKL